MRRLSKRQRIGLGAAGVALAAAISVLIVVVAIATSTAAKPTSSATSQPSIAIDQPIAAAKLLIDAEGMVALHPSDLKPIGWDTIDPAQLHVYYQGREQPVWLHDNTLVFYGSDRYHDAPISPTRYMSETVYWLRQDGSGRRSMVANATIDDGVSAAAVNGIDYGSDRYHYYTATVHAEDDRLYAPQVKEGDHWFWAQLPAPITRTFTVTLRALAPGPARVTIETWASTESPASPDHHYRIAVNGQPLADETWDGIGRHMIGLDVTDGVLKEGDNVVQVEAPGMTGVTADTTYVDWIEARFPRRYVAEADRLIFDSPGGQQSLAGFSGPIEVFDVTQPDAVTRTHVEANASFAGELDHHYVAVGPGGYQSAHVVPARLAPDLHAVDPQTDYVAIGPSDLLEPLKPLLEWRAAHGHHVLAVPVEAVYDQFGDGRIDPEAIRAFVRAVKPKYVLLVGDASYDPLGHIAPPAANRLPTFLVQTIFGGETGSDVGFAQMTDDGLPEVAIGRVPAREAAEVTAFVDKTLAYERSAPNGAWRQRVLAVADGQEASFKGDAQAFLDQFKSGYETALINPPPNTPDASQQVIDGLNAGAALVAYFGHGSVTQWGKDNLFTVQDSAALKNGDRLPVVINMTCLTGLFIHPKVSSLAETLLLQPAGGAVAVIAPTSLTLAADQSLFARPLAQAYLADPAAPLGDVVLTAWRSLPADTPGTRDVLRTFLLFGDPALVVASRQGGK
jgi:hypothetical protein